jgi:AcrR family transcriptional regulator
VAEITDTRAAILAAAIDILQREGAGALTVRSVAALAGCSTTGVYTWFGGKSGLIDAIFIDGFERFGEAVESAAGRGGALRQLVARAEAYRTWARHNPTHYMVMFGKAVPDYVPSEEAMVTSLGTFDALVRATAGAIDAGELAGEPFDVAHHLWAGLHGYVSLEIAGMDLGENDAQRERTFNEGLTRLLKGCKP